MAILVIQMQRGSSSGFSSGAVIAMAIGISMIVLGFLRRSWNKKDNNEQ